MDLSLKQIRTFFELELVSRTSVEYKNIFVKKINEN